MCILCKEEIIKKLTIEEIKSAGKELIDTTDCVETKMHVISRLWELHGEYDDE